MPPGMDRLPKDAALRLLVERACYTAALAREATAATRQAIANSRQLVDEDLPAAPSPPERKVP